MIPFFLFLVLSVGGHSFDYNMIGGSITNATIDNSTSSLLLHISATQNGVLALQLPRTLIDSRENGSDVPYLVVEDGMINDNVKENDSSASRDLVIPFNATDQKIVIIGTYAAPEFSQATILLTALAFSAIGIGSAIVVRTYKK